MKNKLFVFFSIIIAVLLVISIIAQADTYTTNPFTTEMPLENPLISTMDKDGNIYVIDQSMKRIVKMDPSGNALFTLSGGKRSEDTFFYALELVTDDNNNLYVLNEVLDENGQYVEREDILRYDPDGKSNSMVYSAAYEEDNRPLRKGRLCSLSVDASGVYCYSKEKDSFTLLRISMADDSSTVVYSIDFPEAESLIIDFATSNTPAYSVFTTKKGEMYKADASNKPSLLFPSAIHSDQSATKSIPWEVEPGEKGGIYFTDLGQKQIQFMDVNGIRSVLLSDKVMQQNGFGEQQLLAYRLSVNRNGIISTVFNGQILCLDSDSRILLFSGTAKYPVSTLILRLLIWAQLPVLALLLIILSRLLYIKVLRGKISTVVKQSTFLVAAVILCSLFLSNMIFNNYNSRYETELFNGISQNIQLISNGIDGDLLNGITNAGDFMNPDYIKLRESLHSSFNDNSDSWNEGLYGAVYKVEDNQLYAMLYYDDSVCPYYPLYSEPDDLYMQAYREGSILTLKESDAEGDWMYGVGPIYDSNGKISGLLEVGTDLYGFTQENARLKNNLILEIGTILIILILILIEITILSNIISEKRRQKSLYPDGFPGISGLDVSSIRPLCFVIYTAGFMSQAFIPLFMKKLYTPLFGLPENLVLGLPLSAEALFIALSAVFGGYLIDRKGWKRIFITGLAIFTLGQLFSALAGNAQLFILARIVSGTGFGLSLISMQSFVIMPVKEEDRNTGISALNSGAFAGINSGVVIGSMLAERIGFANVFYISSALALTSLLLGARFMKNRLAGNDDKSPQESSFKSLFRFLSNRRVISFYLLILIPVAVCLMFLDFYFPLFSESQGLTPANIGRAFLLNGLSIVYLGPILSRTLTKYIGNRLTLIVAGLLTITAILQFALQGTLFSAFVAVILIGISESFGITAKISYFTSLPAVKEMGEGKALGYYGLAENLGQVLGPIVYGSVIVLGILKGIGLIGLAVLLLLAVFSVTTIRYRNRKSAKDLNV